MIAFSTFLLGFTTCMVVVDYVTGAEYSKPTAIMAFFSASMALLAAVINQFL